MNWRRGRVRVRVLNETENIDSSAWNNGIWSSGMLCYVVKFISIYLVHVRKYIEMNE